MNPKLVIPNHAQLTVSCPIGANGPNVPRLAELDTAQEPETLLLNLKMEVDHVDYQPNGKLAISNHALWTAFWPTGLYGQLALNHVDQDPELVHVRSSLPLISEENCVNLPRKLKHATPNHALSIASCPNGHHIPNVTELVDQDLKPELAKLSVLHNLEE